MSLSVEELLKPRYKVIADYPGNVQPVGHIHEVVGDTASVIYWCMNKEKYPHLFRKLEWWEERREEEMPEYVREVDSLYKIGEVIKVVEWEIESEESDLPCFRDEKDNHFTWVRGFLPATEEEYTTYIKSLKQSE